jgi:hypothetical protein
MEKITPSQPTLPTTTIETVTKRTEQVPATAPTGSKPYLPAARTPKDDPNAWFKSLTPDERNDYAYYLYRLDPNIVIMDPNLDDRARGAMLDKLTPQDIQSLAQGDFLDELKMMLKARYGGGKYQIKIVHLKAGTMIHNKALIIDGNPILSKREGWTGPGMPPGTGGGSGGGDAQLIPIIMKIIDEKLSGIAQRREDPGQALSEVMKAGLDSQNKAFEWILANMPKAADPTQRLSEIKEMLQIFAVLKEQEKPAAAPVDPMIQIKQMLEMMKLLREAEAPPATNTGEIIRNAIAEGFKQLGSVKRGAGPDIADRILDIVKAGAPVLAPIGMAIAEKIKHAPLPSIPGQPQPPGALPAAQPRIVGVTSAPGPGVIAPAPIPAANVPAPAATPQLAQPTVLTDDLMTAANWHTITMQFIDKLTHDVPGDQFAAAMDYMFPEVTIRMRGMTVETLSAFVKGEPTLTAVKDDPRLPQFITDFLGYFQAPETPEAEPVPESSSE